MKTIRDLRIKIFADGADKAGIIAMSTKHYIKGFTTNPTLMRRAGVTDYRAFACEVLKVISDRPISFEVMSDEFEEMERQAMEIAGWGENVYVKLPITNTRQQPVNGVARRLARAGVKLNITAITTLDQVRSITESLAETNTPSFVSVFAGRIADTGRDPCPMMAAARELLRSCPSTELIWASPRQLLDIYHADEVGCHIITVTNDILGKLSLIGKDLDQHSLDTVKMFYDDACRAGYVI